MPALAPSSTFNFLKTNLGNPFSSSLSLGQRANLLSTASAADFGITGVTKGIGSALFSLDGLINIAGIALFFCNPATSLIGAGLFLFSAGASLFKAGKHAFSALGSLAKFDLVGFATNGLTAAFYAASALPLGKVAGSLNMLKTNAMKVAPLEGEALAKFTINNLSNPAEALKIMNRNIARLKGGLDAERGIVQGFTKQLGSVERGLAKSVGVTPANLTDDVIKATQKTLEGTLKAAQKASDSAAQAAKQLAEKALKDATLKEAAEKAAKEAAERLKDLTKLQQKQKSIQKLLERRSQLTTNIEYASTRRDAWQGLYNNATSSAKNLDAARRAGTVPLMESEILATYNKSLSTVIVDRRKFFDEALELFYGKELRQQAGATISRTAEAGRTVRDSVREGGGVLPALRKAFKGKPPIPSTVSTPAGGTMSTAGYVERNGLLVRAAG